MRDLTPFFILGTLLGLAIADIAQLHFYGVMTVVLIAWLIIGYKQYKEAE